jgi:hypothetical protein
MLSPGKHHLEVPKDYEANLDYRKAVLECCLNNPREQHLVRMMAAEDALWYVSTFVVQYNPLTQGDEAGPFITWPCEEEAIKRLLWCVDHKRSAVMEKSREMGGTYACILASDWFCITQKRKKVLVISRSAEAVDNPGDPDCVFWKLDYVHRHLPTWLTGTISRRSMYFGFDRSESKITGAASTGKAGVGGRASIIFIDEFPMIREDREVRQRTASTTDCRWFNGTHLGVETEFYALTQQPEIEKIQLHWSMHPEKRKGLYQCDGLGKITVLDKDYDYGPNFNFVKDGTPTGGPYPGLRSPWYDWKCKDIGSSRGVAMDLDINPTGAVSQFFDALVVRELQGQYCRPALWEGEVKVDSDTGRMVSLERRAGGPLRLWLQLDSEGKPPLARYCMGQDISLGTGATNSCASIVNGETGEKVGEYTDAWIRPEEFAKVCVGLATTFRGPDGPAKLIWEMQGPGVIFGKTVIEVGFRNIHYRDNEMKIFGSIRTDTPGWYPTDPAKLEVLESYRKALRTREFLNRSKEALDECLLFKYSPNGKKVYHSGELSDADPSGAGVNHGDRVMADALAWKLAREITKSKAKEKVEEIPVMSLAWRRALRKRVEVET